ncbi:tyrosine-type recombinase/integrase [Streptomyces sp. NPDC053499]|uniref:site-specific integrase n=1 Tax=Streptomyces sp. NPDC053499 TaxID=3365707 RepID=UPI0037D6F2E5
MPLLFQWWVNGEDHILSVNTIRKALNEVIEAAQLTDAAGELLDYQPHDFRRIFITDAIMNGLPPHIAQVIAGHDDINTTMHYIAVYLSAAIAAHQAFTARRRSLRPGEEYRVPTREEWDAFLGHFERRKLSLGTCGRSFGSECVHEHACIRCAMLRVDPHERPASTRSGSTSPPGSPKPNAKAGSAKSTGSASASPLPRTNSRNSTPKSPADPPWSTSACPPSARSPPDAPNPRSWSLAGRRSRCPGAIGSAGRRGRASAPVSSVGRTQRTVVWQARWGVRQVLVSLRGSGRARTAAPAR